MEQNLIILGFCLVLSACGNDTSSSEFTTSESSSTTTEAKSEESDKSRNVLHQMPDSDQIEDGYEAILKKADVDDPELLEVYVNFSKSIVGADSDDAHMSLQMVSPKDKNKIVSYRYMFGNEAVEGPEEVTISAGIGASEKFIDTYDGFKQVLFRKSDIMDFDKADDVYKEAVTKSGYDAKDCYVHQLMFKYMGNGELRGDVSVQSTRSTTAHKSFSVDKQGKVQ
ncbi:hypothetical protein IC229_33830 [Spirosoma sp. BT702]|uniref:Uncharacterized protein n=1 Tax=Spirosoma profusum TaxID=2771354 RepID=A0A927GAS4_9BACT|nr:hypothetical protein [Spirosoma profusum]MBD2705638.1 hypothetical protein [Spirosoma profusum]